MDIKDLQYVNSIIEWNSFSKAAKQLYISQPALSQSIKRLESELGLTLFLRDRNYVIPTDAALLIRQQSQPILQAFQRLQQDLANYSQAPSTVTLGISQFYGHHMLSVILPHFNENRPEAIIGANHAMNGVLKPRLFTICKPLTPACHFRLYLFYVAVNDIGGQC